MPPSIRTSPSRGDPSHWLWQAALLLRNSRPVPDRALRLAVDDLAKHLLQDNVWRAPRYQGKVGITPAVRSDEVVTAHVLYNLAFLQHRLDPAQRDTVIGLPVRALIAKPHQSLWSGQTPGGKVDGDCYVASMLVRALTAVGRHLPEGQLHSDLHRFLADPPSPVLLNAECEPAVLCSERTWKAHRLESDAADTTLEDLERSLQPFLGTQESINQPKTVLEWSIPLLPGFVKVKRVSGIPNDAVPTTNRVLEYLERILFRKR